MEILYNKEGIPLLMQSTYVFGETSGLPANQANERLKILMPYDLNENSYIDIDGVKVRPWGAGNDFPQIAEREIAGTSVLNTGLKFLRNLTLGQGIYPCRVKGFDDNGNELLDPITDSRVQKFVASRQVRRYMEKVLYTIDELTGLVTATALMRPERMKGISVKSIKKKWKDKSFAAGVNRDVIQQGAEMLGKDTAEIIQLAIDGMTKVAPELGLWPVEENT